MIPEERMPPKLDSKIRRLQLVIGEKLFLRIDAWRRRQPVVPMPNTSEAIRSLIEKSLDIDEAASAPNGVKPKKPKKAR